MAENLLEAQLKRRRVYQRMSQSRWKMGGGLRGLEDLINASEIRCASNLE